MPKWKPTIKQREEKKVGIVDMGIKVPTEPTKCAWSAENIKRAYDLLTQLQNIRVQIDKFRRLSLFSVMIAPLQSAEQIEDETAFYLTSTG